MQKQEIRIPTASNREVTQVLPAEGWVVARMVLGQEVITIARLVAWGIYSGQYGRFVAGLVAEPFVGIARVADPSAPGGTCTMSSRSFIGYFPSEEAAIRHIMRIEELQGWTVIDCDGLPVAMDWTDAAPMPRLEGGEG